MIVEFNPREKMGIQRIVPFEKDSEKNNYEFISPIFPTPLGMMCLYAYRPVEGSEINEVNPEDKARILHRNGKEIITDAISALKLGLYIVSAQIEETPTSRELNLKDTRVVLQLPGEKLLASGEIDRLETTDNKDIMVANFGEIKKGKKNYTLTPYYSKGQLQQLELKIVRVTEGGEN